MNKKKFYIYSLILFSVFIVITSSFGLFKIGILSDTFGDAYTAVNSTVTGKITNNLEYIDTYRYRPVLFLTLKGIVNINNILGFSYDNFILYKLINIFLYLFFAFISGLIVLKISGKFTLSILTEALILIFPNNLHNFCWSAAYFEILCGIFYLLAFLFLIKYLNIGTKRFLIYSNILFVIALLTKEIAITFPFVCIVVLYLMYSKMVFKKYKSVYISQLAILFLYFISKSFLSKGIPIISGKYFEGDFWINSIQVILKGIIALTIPLDFSVLKIGLKDFNILFVIYLLVVVILTAVILFGLIKQKRINVFLLIGLNFLILISPYIYAGYIRPQLILLPFTMTLIILISFVDIKSFIIKRITIVIFIFWIFWGYSVIDGWKHAYAEGKERMENLLKTNFSKDKKIIIIGNPARMQQYFIYDNVMFPYNYFKYHSFTIKDTLYDFIRTIALDKESLNSELIVNIVGNKEYDISCTGKTQFFYLDGDESQIKKNKGIKNDFITAEFLEYNNFGKPIKIKIKFFNENFESYIFQGKNLVKLN
jgi:hypothetical protein